MRLRAGAGILSKLKVDHSILENLKPILISLLQESSIKAIIPGSIEKIKDAKGKKVVVRVTAPVRNGHKAIAQANGARQEIFFSTSMTSEELAAAFVKAGACGH